jgi:predicted Zn-dependent protease
MEDWSVAYSLLNELVKIVPNRAILHLDLTTCLISLGRLPEARRILKNEESRLRGRYPYHVLLARLAALEGDPALAARHLRRAIQMDSSGARALAHLCPALSLLVGEQELRPGQLSAGTTDGLRRSRRAG